MPKTTGDLKKSVKCRPSTAAEAKGHARGAGETTDNRRERAPKARNTPTDKLERRGPGRPRSEEARIAILRATLKMLSKTGYPELCIEKIATEANVGKATVYRWWPDKASLVAEAFSFGARAHVQSPDTGSALHDAKILTRGVIDLFHSPLGRTIRALLGGGQSDPELLTAFRTCWFKPRREAGRRLLNRCVSQAEIRADCDLDLFLDALYGAIYFRFLVGHAPVSDRFFEELFQMLIDGAGAARGNRKSKPIDKPA
jgi:AcrR family transcriptional regulator